MPLYQTNCKAFIHEYLFQQVFSQQCSSLSNHKHFRISPCQAHSPLINPVQNSPEITNQTKLTVSITHADLPNVSWTCFPLSPYSSLGAREFVYHGGPRTRPRARPLPLGRRGGAHGTLPHQVPRDLPAARGRRQGYPGALWWVLLAVCLSIYLSMKQSIILLAYKSVSICQSISFQLVYLSAFLSLSLSACLSVYLSFLSLCLPFLSLSISLF